MISFSGAAFSYPHGQEILRDVSFSFGEGDCVCLLGPNGTGKTTLLKCLLGHLKLRGGSICIDGRESRSLSAKERARRVAYVAQATALNFHYTAEEVILMGRAAHMRLGCGPSKKDLEIAAGVMERLGIADMAGRDFQRLSGGERQMVLFGRALAQQARYLVLDEPTAALDYSNQIRILQTILSLAEEGYGILMTTHFPDHAFLACNKAVLMRDGSVLAAGPPKEVVSSESLTELYRVPVCVTEAKLAYAGEVQMQEVCVPVLAEKRA